MINLIKDIYINKKIIITLAVSNFKNRFVGSYFGIVWMFVNPLATVFIYTFVFQIGFRAVPPIENLPYVLWLIPGIIPWFYFSEVILQGTNSLYEYNYLVKKVLFNVTLLPIIKLIASLIAHFCFLVIMFLIFFIFKRQFSFNNIYIFYFTFCASILSLAIIFLTSSINVFFKDMYQIVSIVLQFGIWLSPIMYDESIFLNRYNIIITILKLNPFYYIVKGYRFAMINESFKDFLNLTIYFWIITIIILIFGINLFNKLKLHFSDVL